MKKVLVAVDIARSVGNDNCLKTAQEIAGTMDGQLIMLHVIDEVPSFIANSLPAGTLEKRRAEAKDELDKLAADYKGAEVVVLAGHASNIILEYASEIKADLIVINSHDPGLADYFYGSVASSVVRHAHCSVHIVRHPDTR